MLEGLLPASCLFLFLLKKNTEQNMSKQRLENILKRIQREHPQVTNALERLQQNQIKVGGVLITNPRSMVNRDAPLQVEERELRGTTKLRGALTHFGVDVSGRISLDVGACTGGFTTALLEAGAARVYAVDAGAGQLAERLRRDARVVNLEQTNLGSLNTLLIPEVIQFVTLDLSYLSLSDAAPQLESLLLADGARMLALVKPMFELGLHSAPQDDAVLSEALRVACDGLTASNWRIEGTMRSIITGRGGAIEFFVLARRAQGSNQISILCPSGSAT
jgi:23S rRNA (cytidine1920-2'-O)/16S rRNA (cytidine1409-2'-O)-methyltransferase